jgi:hypothetical protein
MTTIVQHLHRSVLLLTVSLACLASQTDARAQNGAASWRNLSPEQLSTVHWKWILGTQVSASPVFDETGANAFVNQPYFHTPGGAGQLLFLAGTFSVNQLANGDILGEVTRNITIKQGTALFFPLIDGEWDNVLQSPHLGGMVLGHPVGIPTLTALVAMSPDNAVGLFSTLDGADAGFARLQSDAFAYTLPATDNLLQASGIDVKGTVAPVISDGFWSFVGASSLAPGNHVLRFGGAFPYNDAGNLFSEDITYNIIVTP